MAFYIQLQVSVRVYNRLQTEGVTFHWHGILQKGTPWMDGASMISQCPIMPGQMFEYRYTTLIVYIKIVLGFIADLSVKYCVVLCCIANFPTPE